MKRTLLISLYLKTLFLGMLLSSIRIFAEPSIDSNRHFIDEKEWEKRVTVKKLNNGLTVILIERHEVPIFSAFLRVNAGSVNEEVGKTGLAHMFEHMAFQGTSLIGTTQWEKEKAALEKLEVSYQAYQQEQRKGKEKDEHKLKELAEALEKAQVEADAFVKRNEFSKIAGQAGCPDLNAYTNSTETGYMNSFPISQFEIWAYLESERLRKPVMREFYRERASVQEERRMRTESNPTGRLIEQFYAAAFLAHPYHQPPIGWPSDIQTLSATDAKTFWEDYYAPSNVILSLAGGLNPSEVMPIIEAYFGRIPSRPGKVPSLPVEPLQNAERQVILTEDAEPVYIEGYHRGNFQDPDDSVYDLIEIILVKGKTSRLYKSLVVKQKIAAAVDAEACTPSGEYPCLFALEALPMKGHTAREVRKVLHAQIEILKQRGVSQEELESAKRKIKVSILDTMTKNMDLAILFAKLHHFYKDWKEGIRQISLYDKVTIEDIKRVAQKTFRSTNRTAAWIEQRSASSSMMGVQ